MIHRSVKKGKIQIRVLQGLCDYKDTESYQFKYSDEMISYKSGTGKAPKDEMLIIAEHSPVITVGRRGNPDNILYSMRELMEIGIDVHKSKRGGDVTIHGPGQITAYPIIDLQSHGLGVKDYVWKLEEVVIRVLRRYGIMGERIEGATGVWIGKGTNKERKICAIGIRCSHFVTMYGIGFNINNDLSIFRLINPCGFVDKGVTSLEKEISNAVDINEVKEILISEFLNEFELESLNQ